MPTLAEVQEGIYAGFAQVPFHKHLGVEVERLQPSGARVAIPTRPELAGPDGEHSPAAVYTLGDVASSVRVCELIVPRALELELGALFLTVAASFRPQEPAYGRIEATASTIKGLDDAVGESKETRKAIVETEAKVVGEGGRLAAVQRMSFYVRFMDASRVREMAPRGSEILRLHEL